MTKNRKDRKGKNKKCGLEQRIQVFQLPKEEGVEFVPYCFLRWHPGIIREKHYLQCRKRECWHYMEFKLSDFNQRLRKKYDNNRHT